MRVVIGRIGRPHGIRGEVTIEPRTDEPDRRFAEGATVLTVDGPDLRIERSAWQGRRLVVKFVGIEDRDSAEGLRDTILEVERDPSDRPEDPDEFYDSDLVGLRVILPTGDELGTVREVLHLPAQDLLAIDGPGGEVLVPFLRAFVPSVDLEAGVMTVSPPDGLVD